MAAPLTAPPWEDVGQLLSFGSYMYLLLLALAVSCAYMNRSPVLRRLASPTAPLQHKLGNSLNIHAVSEFFARHAVHMAVFRMVASTAICIVYVCCTYIGQIHRWLLVILKLLAILLTLQFVGKMLVSPRPVSFVLHGESIMEVYSLSSLIMAKPTDWLNFSFLQAYIVLARYFQIEPTLELVFMEKTSPFHRQLTRLTLEFIVFIYVFACGLQLFERLGDPWSILTSTTFELTLANSFYFTVCTIFTVGYGDFVPYTLMGRLWIIFLIVFGAYLVSRKISQVVDVVSGLRRGLGSFVKGEGVEHCVICGNVKWEYLKSFVQEFYGDNRNDGKKLVVICDQPNWTEETWNKFFASQPQFRNNVVYLEGSCVTRDDLVRAQVDDAKAVFVLNNQHNPDPYAEDSETLKRILTIRSYMPNMPIYSMCALRDSMLQITYALEHLSEIEAEENMSRRGSMPTGINVLAKDDGHSPEDLLRSGQIADEGVANHPASAYYSAEFTDDDDDVDGLLVPSYDGSSDLKSEAICMQEVEMSLLAENVFCNGLSTLLANLILRVNPQAKPTDQPWAIEYKIGSECRFEYVKLPMGLHDRKFSEIAMIMYDYGVLLVATKRFIDKKWRAVTPDTTIHLSTIGLIITFHSTHFLEKIMLHIAARVRDEFKDASSDGASQDISSPEDEFAARGRAGRYNLAGDMLTGDVSVAYEYEADDFVVDLREQPPMFQENAKRWWQAPATTDRTFLDTRQEASAPVQVQETSRRKDKQYRDGLNPQMSKSTSTSGLLARSAPKTSVPAVDRSQDTQFSPVRARSSGLQVEPSSAKNAPALEHTDEGLQGTRPESYPELSTISTTTKRKAIRADSMPVMRRRKSDNPSGGDVNEQGADDRDRDSEDGPPSALRSSTLDGDGSSAKRPNKSRSQHVAFITQKPREGSGAASGVKKQKADLSVDADRPFIFFGDDELPMKVREHIVVCAIGQMAMMNLKHFLQRVWVARGTPADDTPVVAICPRLTDEDEADLSAYASGRLFVIQGNSLSVKTLKRAQFDQAKAIVILACEDKNDVDHMDAKAIFTVMTLDYLLGERSETFVCTMLDAEESMQLLRAPAYPRRRGADLGLDREVFLEFGVSATNSRGIRGDLSLSRLPSINSSHFKYLSGRGFDTVDSKRSIGERTFSFGALSGAGDLPRSMSYVGIRNSTYTDRKMAIEKHLGIRDTSLSTRKFSQHSFGQYRHHLIPDDDDIMNNPSIGGTSALNFLMNPSTITMGGGVGLPFAEGRLDKDRAIQGNTANRARDESFEKQRYASGEMMISSTYMSLLIREYAMPGLMAVVRKIFGAGMGKNAKPKRCWIRTLQVPHLWISSGKDGQRTYREVFEVLLKHGAVALGLYRSGDVTVRVPLQMNSEFDSDEEGTSPETSFSGRYFSRIDIDSPRTQTGEPYDSAGFTDGEVDSNTLEMGGDSVQRLRPSRSFERSGILQNLPSYGTMHDVSPIPELGESNLDDTETTQYPIPPSLLFDMAEDVQAAQQTSETNVSEDPGFQFYTCPSSGRTAMFKEIESAQNVLPYVYTNPEAYTLVSEHDAVYVLVSPQVRIPIDDW